MSIIEKIKQNPQLHVEQVFEHWELLSYETRNKFKVNDSSGNLLYYVAEQNKGAWQFILRQFLGHWRPFEVHFFSPERELLWIAKHPFRFFFRHFEVQSTEGVKLGHLQQRFSLLKKSFDVCNKVGAKIFTVRSPIYKPWTFVLKKGPLDVATIKKKWSGLLTEAFSDKDNFTIDFHYSLEEENDYQLIISSAFFIDLLYFEKKAND